jgi:hypothetical protein
LETRQLEEVERTEDGHIFYPTNEGLHAKYDEPICFAGVYKLQSEYTIERIDSGRVSIIETGDNSQVEIQQVLTRLRPCDAFIKWIQGFTPKEHREMVDREWQQKHQEEREEDDRKWREERMEDDRKWRSQQERMNRIYTIVSGVVGAVTGAIIAWLLTRGG